MTEKKTITFEDGELTEFASNSFLSVFEAAGAIATGNPFGMAISVAHLLKNARGYAKLKSITHDVFRLRKCGTISVETVVSTLCQDNLLELMDALEKDTITEEKFNILRKIFLQGLVDIEKNKDKILVREILVQARKLEPSEILVLGAIWDNGNQIQPHSRNEHEYLTKVEHRCGLPTDLCKMYIYSLEKKGFLARFDNNLGKNCEITIFGRIFCSYLQEYDRMEKSYFSKE